jgi:hypothetical protein
MECRKVKLPGGIAILCGRFPRRKPCSACREHVGDKLCDGKVPGKRGTCDAPICGCCATTRRNPKKPSDTLDFCKAHADQAPCSCSNAEDENYAHGNLCCACDRFYVFQFPIGRQQVCPCGHARAPVPEQLELGGSRG